MIQVTPHMRILVAVEPEDFRRGIDGLARVCREVLQRDPFSGWMFVFRNRRAATKMLLRRWGTLPSRVKPTAVSLMPRGGI